MVELQQNAYFQAIQVSRSDPRVVLIVLAKRELGKTFSKEFISEAAPGKFTCKFCFDR